MAIAMCHAVGRPFYHSLDSTVYGLTGGKGGWWQRPRGAGILEPGARDVSSSGGSRPTDGPCLWRREERG